MNTRLGALLIAAAAWGVQLTSGKAEAQIPEAREGRQVVLVTGSTDGLGRELALRLGAMGAHVIVHGRNEERGADVVAEIARGGQGTARFIRADFASLEEVRSLASTVLAEYDRLDLLVNNAGIGSSSAVRELSQDGHELRFQVNYLSGFLLTRMLLPLLLESAPARIVNVASAAQNPIDFENVMLERDYTGGRAYGQSKLAQVFLTFDLAEELDGRGIVVNALHPATYMDTQMVRAAGRTPLSTVDEGADAVLALITTPGLQSGQYFNTSRPAQANAQAYDRDARTRLRTLSLELTGLD
jgi:NAD(P)-dependent dehydrogenase (short-subunit alcohol dehydrogenase family)